MQQGGVELSVELGDIVGRKSYGNDILFKVIKIEKKHALIKGLDYRLIADAPLEDLVIPRVEKILDYENKVRQLESRCLKQVLKRRSMDMEKMRGNSEINNFFEIPGKILHIDGDREYLSECLKAYATLNISVYGEHHPESRHPDVVVPLLEKYQPDMLVLTGHDSFIKKKPKEFKSLDMYRNSLYFVEAVKAARRYEPGKDDLIIFAGACHSHYEALLEAGANFASSPQRVLIHCLDPVFIMEKMAYLNITDSVNILEVIKGTITGIDGIGGIETRGKFRLGLPKSPY